MATDAWVADVETTMAAFAARHRMAYQFRQRQLSAAFEIGCFLLLAQDYESQGWKVDPANLQFDEYRYLTTPSGNPLNFSYVTVSNSAGKTWQVRQQVRIRSHINSDIYFTPDIVVLRASVSVGAERDPDYAGGRRGFFIVGSEDVVAAHECKSMPGFPELYLSFVGMSTVAHDWFKTGSQYRVIRGDAGHLAPTLFVGGEASNLHRKMIAALEGVFPMNIITGIHRGGWMISSGNLMAEVQRLRLE